MQIMINFFILVITLFIGNFLNVFIYKIPNTKLKVIDLINPIIRKNKKSIFRDILVSIVTTVVFLLIYGNFNINIYSFYILIFTSILIVISFIDIDHYIIPDSLIIIGVILIISFNIFINVLNLKYVFLGGLICGGSVLSFIYILEVLIKQEIMGGGDIKLFFMVGMFLGTKGGLIAMILSIYIGAIYGVFLIIYRKIRKIEHNSMIPYGPFISLATIIYLLYGQMIIDLYKKIIC